MEADEAPLLPPAPKGEAAGVLPDAPNGELPGALFPPLDGAPKGEDEGAGGCPIEVFALVAPNGELPALGVADCPKENPAAPELEAPNGDALGCPPLELPKGEELVDPPDGAPKPKLV